MIRALIRQDFLPATARGGGGAGGKQGQPKVKFHSQGPKEPPSAPHRQMHFRSNQHYTSAILWLLSEDIEAQRAKRLSHPGQSRASLRSVGRKSTIPVLPWARVLPRWRTSAHSLPPPPPPTHPQNLSHSPAP